MTQKALVTAGGKIVTINRLGVKSIPTIQDEPTFPWIADGEGLIKPADNKKVKEEHIQKELRQIEITATENIAGFIVDTTSLGLTEGVIFNVYINAVLVDVDNLPINGRIRGRINGINTTDYFYGTSVNNGFFMESSDATKINQLYSCCALVGGDFVAKYDSIRINTADARLQTNINAVFRNNNIQQVNLLDFSTQSAAVFIRADSKLIITKLT